MKKAISLLVILLPLAVLASISFAFAGRARAFQKVGDFTSFLSTNTGFGDVIYKQGKVKVKVVYGEIEIQKIVIQSKNQLQ